MALKSEFLFKLASGFKVFPYFGINKFFAMFFQVNIRRVVSVVIVQFIVIILLAQPGVPVTKWSGDGNVLIPG